MSRNEVIFAELWRDPKYVELHRVKDSIKPFGFTDPQFRDEALRQFDAACEAINEYEKRAGIK